MIILGIQFTDKNFEAYKIHDSCHDSSAALIINDTFSGFFEEERLNLEKHTNKFPLLSIKKLLKINSIKLSDVNIIAIPFNIDNYVIQTIEQFLKKIENNFNINNVKLISCDHHTVHAYNSFVQSNFLESNVLIADNSGTNNDCITLANFDKNNNFTILEKINYDVSPGKLYTLTARYCGFSKFNEGSLMGLASFGKDLNKRFLTIQNDKLTYKNKNIITKFVHQTIKNNQYLKLMKYKKYHSIFEEYINNNIDINCLIYVIAVIDFLKTLPPYNEATDLDEYIYYKDIAATIQQNFSEIILYYVHKLKNMLNSENLILAGGCFQNCTTNNIIIESNIFKNIFCSSTMHDSGLSLGCAYYAFSLNNNIKKLKNKQILYSNIFYTLNDISKNNLDKIKIEKINNKTIINDLKNFYIIGWFLNDSEFGPRALCHRSIIANPIDRNALIKINKHLKHRQVFRPFAPVIMDYLFTEVFNTKKTDLSQFMLRTIPINKKYTKKLSAICHIDNTSRPQLLCYKDNPVMYNLLNDFYKETSIPCLLNTSFNDNNQPIIETIDNAINYLLSHEKLNYIVFNGDIKISRKISKI